MKQVEFNRKLSEQLDEIADSQGYDLSVSADRGSAFQFWYSELSSSMEGGFDTETEDAMLTTNDGGVDIVHVDYTDRKLLLIQTKCRSLKAKNSEIWEEIQPFFKKHQDWLNDTYLKTLSSRARENLDIYKTAVKEKWSIEYRYVTTNLVNDRLKKKVKTLRDRLASQHDKGDKHVVRMSNEESWDKMLTYENWENGERMPNMWPQPDS